MCKRRSHRCGTKNYQPYAAPQPREYDGAYEGETVRLNHGPSAALTRHHNGRCGHFPWWTLWLIWPIIGLIKGIALAIPGLLVAAAAFWQQLATSGTTLLAIALMIIGLVIIGRTIARDGEDVDRR